MLRKNYFNRHKGHQSKLLHYYQYRVPNGIVASLYIPTKTKLVVFNKV